MDEPHSFTQGPILGPLLKFTLPVLAAICLQAMYGAVDLAVVGRYGTAADVSAVSTGSQVMQTITFFITSLSMGTTVLLGQKLGQGRAREAGDVIGGGICLFAVVAAVVTAVMLAAAGPFAALLHAPEEAFDKTVSYIRICSAGTVCIVAYNLLGSVFRGLGDSKTPLMAVGIACVCNIAGDLALVGGLGMAGDGAAIATVASQAVSVGLSLLLIRRRGLPFSFGRGNLRFHGGVIRRTLRLGVPVALQDALVSVSFLVILAIVNGLGVVVSAGIGVAEKLCAFVMLVPSAYMQSLSAFAAQNIGAGRDDRACRAMVWGMLTSFCFGAAAAYLTFAHGDALAGVFAKKDDAVVAAAWEYLKAYAIDSMLVSFLFCFTGYFNGRGCTRFVLLEGIAGAFCVRIPVSYFMSRRRPVSLFSIGLATPCSTVVQILLCLGFFWWLHRRGSGVSGARSADA